jgi:hypothetical protein
MKKTIYLLFAIIWMSGTACAGLTRIQTINLQKGWNAIFLEVEPEKINPDDLFANTSIQQVLAYYEKVSSAQYIQDPDEIAFKTKGWYRWVPAAYPQSMLNSLKAMQANQAYLVYSDTDFTWDITGTPKFKQQKWQPDAYNFTGFHVDPQAPPTFFQYFESSKSHEDLIVYTLTENKWHQLEYPSQVNIVSGKAYWVYCKGGSDYQGPMRIILPPPGNVLNYYLVNTEYEIKIINDTPNPLSFSMIPILNTDDNEIPVPLSRVTYSKTLEKSFDPLTSYSPEKALESGDSDSIRLAVRRKDMAQSTASSLLKIIDDLGSVRYIQVWAEKSE